MVRWRSGEVDAFAVNEAIHRFHQGPSRKLCTRYEGDPEWPVTNAIFRGILTEDEAGAEVLELDEKAVVAYFATTALDGKAYQVAHYHLDAVLAVGYRVRSQRGTQFRSWAMD
jgi:hypothetical protein